MKFRTTVLLSGKTATGIQVPEEVVAGLGRGKTPPVRVTIRGHTYRSTVARRREKYLVGISAENRASAGVAAGDEVDVDIELDTESREVSAPPDFAAALDAHPEARQFFHGLSNSQKRWFVDGIEQAKKAETRERRIANAVSRLREGKAQR